MDVKIVRESNAVITDLQSEEGIILGAKVDVDFAPLAGSECVFEGV